MSSAACYEFREPNSGPLEPLDTGAPGYRAISAVSEGESLKMWEKSQSVKLLLAPSSLHCILNVNNKNVNKELAPSRHRSLGC